MSTSPPASPRPLHPFASALARLTGSLELVERSMSEQLESTSKLVPLLGEHVLGSGVKRMRPALVLLAAELCSSSMAAASWMRRGPV